MSDRIGDLVSRIRDLEGQIEDELARGAQERSAAHGYRVEGDDVAFGEEARRAHRRLRTGLVAFLRGSALSTIVSAPLMYAMIVPLLAVDVALWAYQGWCFRIYGIRPVARSAYVVLDRRHLGYLNWIEKLNCDYCSYANGVLAYAREVVSRTEQYWCPIKHARRVLGTHDRYRDFLEYGDAAAWKRELPILREAVVAPR